MRVLVTGHLGYIGTILTPMLVQAGHEVVGLDSDLYVQSRLTLEDFEGPRYQRIGHIKSLLADGILDAGLCHVGHPHRADVPTALSVGSLG